MKGDYSARPPDRVYEVEAEDGVAMGGSKTRLSEVVLNVWQTVADLTVRTVIACFLVIVVIMPIILNCRWCPMTRK